MAALRHFSMEYRIANGLSFRRCPVGNELERASRRDAYQPHQHLRNSDWNAITCGYGGPQALRWQRLRYQGHLPELQECLSGRNWAPQLHPLAGIHERGSWARKNLRHAVEREASASVPLGRLQRR